MAVDRRVGEDRRREVPQRRGFIIYKTEGPPVDVACPAVVLYNYEQQFRAGVNKSVFAPDGSTTKALWMAHEAERVVLGNETPFEDWVKTVVTLDSWAEPLPLAPRYSPSRSPVSALPPESPSSSS
jgi:hypothetical protein